MRTVLFIVFLFPDIIIDKIRNFRVTKAMIFN